jgi:RNA polymerase sigma-70 factor, ECF subfamily
VRRFVLMPSPEKIVSAVHSRTHVLHKRTHPSTAFQQQTALSGVVKRKRFIGCECTGVVVALQMLQSAIENKLKRANLRSSTLRVATLDHATFERIVKEHEATIARVAHHLCRDRQDAQDIVQEVLLKLYTDGHMVRTSVEAWLCRVTRNAWIDRSRKHHAARWMELTEARSVRSTGPTPEEHALRAERRTLLRVALQSVTQAERHSIVLRHLHDLSTTEVARVTGVTAATIRVQLHTGRRKLQTVLSGYDRITPGTRLQRVMDQAESAAADSSANAHARLR